ncbi:MAG: CYTH and CHAD domain-containing protein [Nakamurella sp.]
MSATGMTLHQEIEVKLEAGRDFTVPDLTSIRGVASASEPVEHPLDATYYDTTALDLMQARMTLRHRVGGKDEGWHLKLPGTGPGSSWVGTSNRTELAFPLGDDLPDELSELIRGVTRGCPVVPVASIRTLRTIVELRDEAGTALVELADDAVDTEVFGDVGVPRTTAGSPSWRELEVELLSGDEDTVRLAAARLTKAGAKAAASPSKLASALAAAGRAPLRASPTGTEPNRRSSAQEVVLRGLARHRDALVGADVGLRLGSPESLHASRAAARRLRSALTVFRALFEVEPVDRLLKGLRAMDKVLQPVRDNDVLLARLTSEIGEEPAEFARPAEVLLRRALADRNATAWEDVEVWLDRPQALRLIHRLDAFLAEPPLDRSQHGQAGRLLPAMIAGAWSRVRKLADIALADPEDVKALERVRRAAKSVRYAAELAGTALGDAPIVFAAAVEEIQEVLGEHRNALLVGEFLVALAADVRTSGRAGFLYGRLHAVAGANVLSAVDDFTDAWDRADDGELISWLR